MTAHGYCLLWDVWLVSSQVISDTLIAFAYFLIPVVLLQMRKLFVWQPPRTLLLCFGLFIISCGLTHVMDIVVIWYPFYWLQTWVKLMTAVASMATFVVLADTLKFGGSWVRK